MEHLKQNIQTIKDNIETIETFITDSNNNNAPQNTTTTKPIDHNTFIMKKELTFKFGIDTIVPFNNFKNTYLINNKYIWNFDTDSELHVFDNENNIRIDNKTCYIINHQMEKLNFFVYDYPHLYYFTDGGVSINSKDQLIKNVRVYKYENGKFLLVTSDKIMVPNMTHIMRLNDDIIFYDVTVMNYTFKNKSTYTFADLDCVLYPPLDDKTMLITKVNLQTLKIKSIDALAILNPIFPNIGNGYATYLKHLLDNDLETKLQLKMFMYPNKIVFDFTGHNKDMLKKQIHSTNTAISNKDFKFMHVPLLVNDSIVILLQKTHYVFYDIINDKIIQTISYKSDIEISAPSNPNIKTKIISPVVRFANNKFIVTHASGENDIYVLKDSNDIARENECVVCFHHTDKQFALVPCGHTQYCIDCIADVALKECHICKKTVQASIKIFN